MDTTIKAILWDNDGVLVNTEGLYYSATQEILANIGIDLTKEMFFDLFLVQGKGAWHLAEEKGFSQNEIEKLILKRNRLYTDFLKKGKLLIEGVKKTLEALHGSYQMGIVTSSRKEHFEIIHQSTGLLKYFDFFVTCEQCVNSKPHPEPYLVGVAKTGLSKEECIVIEDSERGLTSAVQAGLKCIIIPNELTKNGNFSSAYAILNHVKEIPSILIKNRF